jgi:hypothetical protein
MFIAHDGANQTENVFVVRFDHLAKRILIPGLSAAKYLRVQLAR